MTSLQARAAWIIGALALSGGGAAPAQGSAPRADYLFELTEAAPNAASGLKLGVFYRHPDDPDRKPPAATEISFELPEGLRLDTAAVPVCRATDEELRARGRGACPPESRVGAGSLTVMTGFPGVDPVGLDVTVFNGVNQLIELVSIKGTETTAGFDRLTLEGRRLVAHPPATPGGPPDGRTTVREVKVTIPARRTPDGRAYITTPPACPPAGRWASTGVFGFADGGRANVVAQSPCIRSASSPPGRAFLRWSARARPHLALNRWRVVRVLVGCPFSTTGCRGRLTLTHGRATLASRRFALGPGVRARIPLRLSPAAAAAARRRGTTAVRVKLSWSGLGTATRLRTPNRAVVLIAR